RGSSSVEFVMTQARQAGPPEGVAWPRYGFDLAGTRDAGYRLRPPFRRLWTFNDNPTLLEFPPAVAYGRLFLPTWDGRFLALDARTGRILWRRHSGRCGWGSPAVWHGLLITTWIGRVCDSPIPGTDGEVVAYEARNGEVRWRFHLGPCESSPLVVGGLVYVGDWHGHVYALDVRTGKRRWVFRTDGAVKGSASYAGGAVYASPAIWRQLVLVGSYDRTFCAFDAATGRVRWRFHANGRISGSASVVDGIVYFSTLQRRTYGLDAGTGRAVWMYPDGEYT